METGELLRARPLFKWMSVRGDLLGTVTFPEWIERLTRTRRCAEFLNRSPVDVRHVLNPKYLHPEIIIGIGTIQRCDLSPTDSVVIFNCTPEQWERIPGHTFSPSAGYLRSLIE